MAPNATAVSTHWSVERLVGLNTDAGMHCGESPTQLCSMDDQGSTEKCTAEGDRRSSEGRYPMTKKKMMKEDDEKKR